MIRRSTPVCRPRAGFTLLEVLLATVIACALLFALYVGLRVHLQSTDIGREYVERATVARSVLNRISADVLANLSPVDPKILGKKGQSGAITLSGAGAPETPETPETTEATAESTANSTTSSTPSTTTTTPGTTTTEPATTPGAASHFNLGVQGDATRLVLYTGRLSRATLLDEMGAPSLEHPEGADLRRVAYYMVEGKGLARSEVKVATSEELNFYPPGSADDDKMVIAPEVREMTLKYFNGTGWVESWDGTLAGADGKTPLGPPMAVEITLVLGPAPRADGTRADGPLTRVVHVVAIPTANSFVPQQEQAENPETTTPPQ
jgi:prepilin-type N-terminal cleavage/methylation domain-containing protein